MYFQGFGIKGQSSTDVKRRIDSEIKNQKNTSKYLFEIVQNELKIGSFTHPDELVKSYYLVDSIHEEFNDIYYLQGLCILTERLQLSDKYNDAYYFLYKANKLFENGLKPKNEFLQLFYRINVYSSYYYMQYEKAEQFSFKVLNCKDLPSVDSIRIYNQLGIIRSKLNSPQKAISFYQKAIEIAQRRNDEMWMGLLFGNIGSVYFEKKEYKKAREYLEKDVHFSLKQENIESAATALSMIVIIDLEENKLQQARNHFDELNKMIDTSEISNNLIVLRTKYLFYEKLGQYQTALNSFKEFTAQSDSIRKKKDLELIKRTGFQIEFEQERTKNEVLEEKKKRVTVIFYSVLLVSIVGILILIYFLLQIVKKRKHERLNALREKHKLDLELRKTEEEMKRVLSNLMEKNEVIELLNTEIELIQESTNQISEEKQKLKNKLTSFTLLTEDDWIIFKRLFENLNPEFFEKLNDHFSDLTNAEIRLIALTKLNLSTNEMSRALGISPDSVRKTNLRLRKKVGIENHEDLIKLILAI